MTLGRGRGGDVAFVNGLLNGFLGKYNDMQIK